MPSNQLHKQLNASGYLCDHAFAAQVAAALATSPVSGAFLRGYAGTGKTYLPEVLTRLTGSELFFEQCFPGCRDDVFKMKYEPCEDTVSGMRGTEGVLLRAARATLEGRHATICIDELDKAQPSVDAFWLDFLQTGRITAGSVRLTADLSRLTVFFTLNDERDLSLPLLRRLPVIEFPPLPVEQVAAALELTHGDSPLLEPACVLYARTLQARLEKPATIQELRQLLDAISHLGKAADWDTLVRQFITKGDEAHAQLAAVESTPIKLPRLGGGKRLSTGAYSGDKLEGASVKARPHPALPQLGTPAVVEHAPLPPAGSRMHGIIPWSQAAYSHLLAYTTLTLGQEQAGGSSIGTFATVVGDEQGKAIVINEPLALTGESCLEPFAKLPHGELVFGLREATLGNVRALWEHMNKKDGGKLVITSFGPDQATAVYGQHTSIKWSAEAGLEVVANLEHQPEFKEFAKLWDKVVEFPATRARRLKEEKAQKELAKKQAAEREKEAAAREVKKPRKGGRSADDEFAYENEVLDYIYDIANARDLDDASRADILARIAFDQASRSRRSWQKYHGGDWA